jgi:hypothetical protein
MRESYATEIAPVVQERWCRDVPTNPDGSANTKQPNAPFRCKIVREMFAELSEEQREEIRQRAILEAREVKKAL